MKYAWRCPLAPPPPWSSSILLFSLIVSTSVNADSPSVKVKSPPRTSRLRSGKEFTSAPRGGVGDRQMDTNTEGRRWSLWPGILEGRRTKDEEGVETGGSMWGARWNKETVRACRWWWKINQKSWISTAAPNINYIPTLLPLHLLESNQMFATFCCKCWENSIFNVELYKKYKITELAKVQPVSERFVEDL